MTTTVYAGRFDFEDGGTYCGGWEDGKAHGHGVCTGPKGMGEFSGVWQFGYEVSGIYIWPSGNCYQGQWMSGKRHGLGVEKKQRWIYKGEWSQGFKGRYGVRMSETSGAKYEGTWANGLQDGYGCEAYADCGTYFGQMAQGMRNGYGIRKSISYGSASRYRSKDIKDSMTSLRSEDEDERTQRERDRKFDENRGGFVLRAKSDPVEEMAMANSHSISSSHHYTAGGIVSNALNGLLRRRRNSLGQSQERRVSLRKTIMSKLTKQKSTSDIDEVNPSLPGGVRAASAGRVPQNYNKKSSFRSTSSNNSVDSRTSNRTAPAGTGLGGMVALNSTLTRTNHHHTYNNNGQLMDDGEHSFISQDEITDVNCIEVYMGEWKQDKRTGFGIAERSDGLKYEGEWFNNKKNGYGVTTFKDGTKEEGKYKNNVLVNDKKKGKLMILRSNKHRERIDTAVNAALKAAQIAQQRADIAISRAVNARAKSNAAEVAAKQARGDSEYARLRAHDIAPDFIQPGELKKMPDIFLEIDKPGNNMNNMLLSESQSNNISPTIRRPPLNVQLKQESYMNSLARAASNPLDTSYLNWQQQQQQQSQQQLPYSPSQQYSPNSQHQQMVLQQQTQNQNYSSNNNTINNRLIGIKQQPTNQNFNDQYYNSQQQQHNYTDVQKQLQDGTPIHSYLNYENIPHLNLNYDENLRFNHAMFAQMQQHSTDPNIAAALQQLQYSNNSQQNSFDAADSNFQRNNPKRNTLKRSQRVMENSVEDLHNHHHHPNQQQQQLAGPKPQYSNASSNQESGIGSSVYTNSTNNDTLQRQQQQAQQQQAAQNVQNSTNTRDNEFIKEKSQPVRRKSLPSIVKNQVFKEDETAHSSNELHNNKIEELYIIENGIRKRITEKSITSITNNLQQNQPDHSNFPNLNQNRDDDQSPQLKRKVIIESITSLNAPLDVAKQSSKRVSMPSIDTLLSSKFASKVMSREEANRLSSLRREQLRNLSNNGSSSLKKFKAMFPDCLSRHRLFIAIILFNISLAIWFFQLLR